MIDNICDLYYSHFGDLNKSISKREKEEPFNTVNYYFSVKQVWGEENNLCALWALYFLGWPRK